MLSGPDQLVFGHPTTPFYPEATPDINSRQLQAQTERKTENKVGIGLTVITVHDTRQHGTMQHYKYSGQPSIRRQ